VYENGHRRSTAIIPAAETPRESRASPRGRAEAAGTQGNLRRGDSGSAGVVQLVTGR